MALPNNADQIVFYGYWWDEITGVGMRKSDGSSATVILTPMPLGQTTAGQTTPNLRDLTAGGRIKTRARVAFVDPDTAYYAVLALASNDPDLEAYGGRQVVFSGEAPFVVEVPHNAPLTTVSAAMAAATGLTEGTQVRAMRLEDAAVVTVPIPTPPINYLTAEQTLATAEEVVDAHDTDHDAHADIRAAIDDVTGAVSSVAGRTGDVTLSKADVGLNNVNNTADANKPVSAAQQAAIDAVSAAVPELARDALGAALVAGANITIVPNDGADTITISAPPSYTDEQAQDAFAALVAAGTHSGISFVYNDAGNALSATVAAQSWSQITGKPTFATVATSGSAADLAETGTAKVLTSTERTKLAGVATGATANSTDAQLRDRSTHTGTQSADTLTDGSTNRLYSTTEKTKLAGIAAGATSNATDAQLRDRATHTGAQTSATISDFTEAVQDAVAALLGAGSNITLNYDDAGNTLTVTAASGGGGGLDAEAVRDTIGVALIGSGLVAVTVNDALDTITITTTATANSTDAQLRDRSTHTGTQAASTVTGLATVATSGAYTDLSGKPTIPSAPGDVGAQPVDGDLTTIAGLDASTSGALATDGSGWIRKTYAQLKTALALVKGDVGLGSVDNTSDAAKPVSTAQQTALDGKQPLDADLTTIAGLTATTDSVMQAKAGAWSARTLAQVAADLIGTTGTTLAAGNDGRFTQVTANTQTASYTLVLADAGKAVEMNVATANTLTIPPNSSVAFPVGTVLEVHQYGAGQCTVTAGAGVTLRAPDGAKTAKQYASASLRKRGTDEWVLAGSVAA